MRGKKGGRFGFIHFKLFHCHLVFPGSSSSSLLTRAWKDELEDHEGVGFEENSVRKELLDGGEGSSSGSGSGVRGRALCLPLGGFLRRGAII
jgi:hypothetical protein